MIDETTESLYQGPMRKLRARVQQAANVEKVLLAPVRVSKMGRKAPTSSWGWTMSELEELDLPVFSFGSYSRCAYCGDPSSCRDHVIAVSYQHANRTSAVENHSGPWCWSCGDCNGALNNRYFDSFKARCEWASWRLNAKAEPIMWHPGEAIRLDYGLRKYVEHNISKRKWLRTRADFYGSRDFYLNLESLIWEMLTIRSNGIGPKFLRGYFSSMLQDISNLYKPNR